MSEVSPFELVLEIPADGFNSVAGQNRKALVDAYQAIVAGNDEALYELLDPDVAFHEAASLPYGGTHHGLAGAQAGVTGMFSAWSHLRVEIEDILASGDLVIAYMHLTATSRATGQVYKGPTAEMFRFKDGKITEWRPIYWDTHAARQACGMTDAD